MKRKRFTTEQIIKTLKEAEVGIKVTELYRKHGISEQTFYNWRNKYDGMEISEAKRLKLIEDENRRLKRLVADLSLDNQVLKELLKKTSNARSEERGKRLCYLPLWAEHEKDL